MGNPSLIAAADAKKLEANPKIEKLVKDIKQKYDAENAIEVVSNSPVELNGDRENVRVRETNLGNVVADSLYQYGQTGFSHPTDIAVTNGGGLRETIAKDKTNYKRKCHCSLTIWKHNLTNSSNWSASSGYV